MFNLDAAFEAFPMDPDGDPSVDADFITDFLMPFYGNLPREKLAAKVLEIIAGEQHKSAAGAGRRKPAARRRHDF